MANNSYIRLLCHCSCKRHRRIQISETAKILIKSTQLEFKMYGHVVISFSTSHQLTLIDKVKVFHHLH